MQLKAFNLMRFEVSFKASFFRQDLKTTDIFLKNEIVAVIIIIIIIIIIVVVVVVFVVLVEVVVVMVETQLVTTGQLWYSFPQGTPSTSSTAV